jgi:hypothetical protein
MVASSGPASIDLANRKVANVPIQGAGPGRYEVTWTTVSAEDGEEASGTFAFNVATSAGSATAADGRTLALEPADMQALFRATWGERAAEEWIAEHNAALARASGGLPAARDGRSLAGEPLATQALFRAIWGDRAAERWAQEHNASLPGGS